MAVLRRHWRLLLGIVAIGALIAVVVVQRHELFEVLRLVRTSNPWWITAAFAVQGLVYFCFAAVYWRTLQLLGYHVRLLSLYGVSFIAIFLGRVFPAGGTSTFAFLLFQLRRRGIPDGTGAVAVTLDGLSYLLGFFVLLTGGFIYLFTHGELKVNQVLVVALLTLAIITFGMYVWGLSRDRALLTQRAISLKKLVARVFRRNWGDTGVLTFIAELYEGAVLIGRDRSGFFQLVVLQVVALLLDCLTLLLLFWSIGVWPHFSVVVLGYSLAYFFSTLSSLPGGGGTFEALMVVTMTNLGVESAIALSVTLLYRLLAFWLPLLISSVIYRRVHYHKEAPPQRKKGLPAVVRD
ncbi:MAG: flippase-like domain-containing protein [Chloroflexota bacterium]|nr:flippase-like domain-containing protein [Chloroflexota bacterium]